ncbi:MAG: NAD-dependent protein deacetylase [Gammaproteobacteria bacterium]|nr:NAD-dependent protein deacetylase [Gammaproteobacteria bacterium]
MLPVEQKSTCISTSDNAARLARYIEQHRSLFVLTGAGCSTASGIPDYRDDKGEWKHSKPVQFQDFIQHRLTRQRYWARSLLGWPRVFAAQPGLAHHALRKLEQAGAIHYLITQNVDRLHQRAGSLRVIDLHGNLERVSCLSCFFQLTRVEMQEKLRKENPAFNEKSHELAPDGDAVLDNYDFSGFHIIDCSHCGGILKPDVVFFGESVPKKRVQMAMQYLQESKALLVVGSSLMVYSGYRFCRAASKSGLPLSALNRGRTRADAELQLKIEDDCGETLQATIELLGL